jgi:p-hydroxybenzoate 3-monooxygenase
MRTQTVIIGAGPAGLLLSQLLHRAGIENVVLEQRSRTDVEGRIRAGVLEQSTVEMLERAGVAARLRREGLIHRGVTLAIEGELLEINFDSLGIAASVTIYGQTEIVKDLIEAAVARGQPPVFEAKDVTIHGIESERPFVTYVKDGAPQRLDCDFVAGCDGQHGVSHACIPPSVRKHFERVYPFGWLGIMAEVPPCHDEIVYASHERGFALASMRSLTRSRCYIQVPLSEKIEDWPDERFWREFATRLGPNTQRSLTTAPSIEKSIAPLRSSVTEPMRHGRLLLAGDAAHIVPPTGAKGLNLAVSDVRFLSEAFIAFYRDNSTVGLDTYSGKALSRVWKAERFSWWLTTLLHRFPDADAFTRKMQMAELDYLRQSRAAQTVLAENYVGLALD